MVSVWDHAIYYVLVICSQNENKSGQCSKQQYKCTDTKDNVVCYEMKFACPVSVIRSFPLRTTAQGHNM